MKKSYSRQMSKAKLLKTVLVRYISAIIIISAVLFIPAGTIRFWNAWLYIACLFIPMVFTGIYYLFLCFLLHLSCPGWTIDFNGLQFLLELSLLHADLCFLDMFCS